ncbi:MAG: hypothetical protein EXR73_11620 [Myxococcales bacterium]|nr:hypothetical protein [Myxococcales bacterium]
MGAARGLFTSLRAAFARPVTRAGRPIRVGNRSDGGYAFWLARLYGFALLALVPLAAGAGLWCYGVWARSTPTLDALDRYASVAPGVTRVFAYDGSVLGELAAERREIVPYDRLPPRLVEAFLAAEDHRFFEHQGLYLRGIARAAWRNLTAGEFAQGGSTITQQVAKQFLGAEKTLARKAREAIVARRLEARYPKEEILSVYLNHIFLGAGAYGVQAAARRYFSKDVGELGLGDLALLAGLAQAPSRDSPLASLANATRRRDEVLDKLVRYGFVPAADANAAKADAITLDPEGDSFLTTEPYFAEHVRRLLKKRYGAEKLMTGGLRVDTTTWPFVESVAYENVDWNARRQDKRQGWRGPEAHVDGRAKETFLERARELYGDGPLTPGRRVLALVEEVESSGARVVVGNARYRLPLARMKWAARWSRSDDVNDREIASAKAALDAGDIVWVSRPQPVQRKFSDWSLDEKMNADWRPARTLEVDDDEVQLEQTPRVQAALLTFDHETGYVVSMVGGQDHARSEFNRAVQACRQPGSTYKPIYYSTALDEGFTFDTLLNDIPRVEIDPITGEEWRPENLHGTMETEVTLEHALVFSKNIPSVDLFKRVGAEDVERWARRLGFTSPIIADRALALGASCTYMDELARAFAIFARNGRWLDLVSVRRVRDRDGRVLEDSTVYWDPMLAPSERLDRLAATAGVRAREAIPARTAFLTTKLLRAMVDHGYNANLRQTGVIAAGKTGTSSATMDTWFVAFTDRWMTAAWLGDDLRERQLGRDDAAYMTAVPFWARYMAEALHGQTFREIPWEVPAGVRRADRGGPTK